MKRFLAQTLTVFGVLMLLLAALAAIAAATSLNERVRFGRGLMFADVEIFAILTLLLGIGGAALLWVGRRLKRQAQ